MFNLHPLAHVLGQSMIKGDHENKHDWATIGDGSYRGVTRKEFLLLYTKRSQVKLILGSGHDALKMPASREEDSWKTQENLALSRSPWKSQQKCRGRRGHADQC